MRGRRALRKLFEEGLHQQMTPALGSRSSANIADATVVAHRRTSPPKNRPHDEHAGARDGARAAGAAARARAPGGRRGPGGGGGRQRCWRGVLWEDLFTAFQLCELAVFEEKTMLIEQLAELEQLRGCCR